MKTFLYWLSGLLPCRIYKHNGVPFLERYFVASWRGRTVYLHRFVRSDPDRGLHDHRWGWAFSLVLSGFYFEQRRDGEHRARWFNRLGSDTFHRVVLPREFDKDSLSYDSSDAPCWTLFVHGPSVKGWGFLRPIEDGSGACFYRPHVDRDGDADSAAWALTAPKGRDVVRGVA